MYLLFSDSAGRDNPRPIPMKHQTRLQINLDSYKDNLRWFQDHISTSVERCAVVKADAYGHGLRLIAPAAAEAGVERFGIVDNREAAAIREMGLEQRIIRLRPATPDEAAEAVPWFVEEAVGSYEQACEIAALNHSIPVHVKIDTGIGRMGFSLPGQGDAIQETLCLSGIRVVGVMTHFPCADENDETITHKQYASFQEHLRRLKHLLPDDIEIHVANSPATLRFSDMTAETRFVRLGISSYGLMPSPEMEIDPALQPVMQWMTHVVLVRDMPAGSTIGYGMTHTLTRDSRIATLPLGYADGYLRSFSNKAHVLVRGKRAPVVGRVSMDMITVDVTDIDSVSAGDEVVLLGAQGGECIRMDELARHANTIDYELACLIGQCNSSCRYPMQRNLPLYE